MPSLAFVTRPSEGRVLQVLARIILREDRCARRSGDVGAFQGIKPEAGATSAIQIRYRLVQHNIAFHWNPVKSHL
jgi:hypothetical protein